jgi:type III secretory pathway component EscR|tara:strand:- start:2317 stop:2736 length:420 start_codon:yes stop_codon:yes gene_type:complete
MNYKLSKREQMLLKVLGVISVLFLIYFIEMRIISNLSESREALSNQVQTFNASKQQLSQLKDYEDKIRNRSSVTVFTNHLDEKNYTYQNKEDLLEVTILSETNLIELLNFMNNEGVNITSIKIKLVDENNLTLSVDFDN